MTTDGGRDEGSDPERTPRDPVENGGSDPERTPAGTHTGGAHFLLDHAICDSVGGLLIGGVTVSPTTAQCS